MAELKKYVDLNGLAYAFSLLKAFVEEVMGSMMDNVDLAALIASLINSGAGIPPIVTTEGDGSAYTATTTAITSLTAGTSVIIIPHTASTNTAPTLDINGLGAKAIRRRLSNLVTSTQTGLTANWLASGKPFLLRYDGTYWIAVEQAKPAAQDLYGAVKIANGGTGATTPEEARENLGVAPALPSTVAVTGSTTLTIDHVGKVLLVNSGNAVTITIPTFASKEIPVGSMLTVTGLGTGTVTFAAASGVTIQSKEGALSIDGQYGGVSLYHSSQDVWIIWGALA